MRNDYFSGVQLHTEIMLASVGVSSLAKAFACCQTSKSKRKTSLLIWTLKGYYNILTRHGEENKKKKKQLTFEPTHSN